MIVRKLRLEKGWSQEQLAEFSGLSIRTIQRVERGQKAGLESMKSIAAVFEVDIDTLMEQADDEEVSSEQELEAIEYVRDLKGFYSHVISYIGTLIILFVINLLTSFGQFWVVSVAIGWGIGLVAHGASVFEVVSFLGPDWEKKQVDKRLGRR